MTLIMSSISSFEMIIVIPYPALIMSAPLVTIPPLPQIFFFFWITPSIAEEDVILAHGAITFLAKGTATLINGPINMPNNAPVNPPD